MKNIYFVTEQNVTNTKMKNFSTASIFHDGIKDHFFRRCVTEGGKGALYSVVDGGKVR